MNTGATKLGIKGLLSLRFLTKVCGGAEAVGAGHHVPKNALASRHVERGAAFAARCVAHGLWGSVAMGVRGVHSHPSQS